MHSKKSQNSLKWISTKHGIGWNSKWVLPDKDEKQNKPIKAGNLDMLKIIPCMDAPTQATIPKPQ